MRRLDFAEFCSAAGLTKHVMNERRRRHHLVIAFGARAAYDGGVFLDLDVAAVEIAEELSRSINRGHAATIVETGCYAWAAAVAAADASAGPAVLFCGLVLSRSSAPRSPPLLFSAALLREDDATAMRERLIEAASRGYDRTQVACVDVRAVLARVRARAKRAGIDLSASFLPPPDSTEFAQIFAPYGSEQLAEQAARRAGILARATIESRLV